MNVVLIIVDSLHRSCVGAYGNKWVKTPNLIDQKRKLSVYYQYLARTFTYSRHKNSHIFRKKSIAP